MSVCSIAKLPIAAVGAQANLPETYYGGDISCCYTRDADPADWMLGVVYT